MYVRLAFSVAAHLDPEIFVIDEVLAVGDAAFQKKCLGKMRSVASAGSTVLLVSHNMGVMQTLASKAIWLDRGHMAFTGEVAHAISSYLSLGKSSDGVSVDITDHPNRLVNMNKILRTVQTRRRGGEETCDFSQLEDVTLEIHYGSIRKVILSGCGFILKTIDGIVVGGFNTYMAAPPPHRIPERGIVRFGIPARQLTPGTYSVSVSVGSHQGHLEDKVEDCLSFTVHAADIYQTGYLLTREDGVVALSVTCEMEPETACQQVMTSKSSTSGHFEGGIKASAISRRILFKSTRADRSGREAYTQLDSIHHARTHPVCCRCWLRCWHMACRSTRTRMWRYCWL